MTAQASGRAARAIMVFLLGVGSDCGRLSYRRMRRFMLRASLGAAVLAACGPPAAAAPATRADPVQAAERVIEATNAFRREAGLRELASDEKLAATARDFAQFMARTGKFGHDADGRTPSQRAAKHGYEYCLVAENIGYQFRTRGYSSHELAGGLVEGWKNSPGHRKNLADRDATEIGVGIARGENGRYYAVQMFARPAALATEFSVANESRRPVEYRIGSKTYGLGPRMVRTHQACVAESVALPDRTVLPSRGDRLVIGPDRS